MRRAILGDSRPISEHEKRVWRGHEATSVRWFAEEDRPLRLLVRGHHDAGDGSRFGGLAGTHEPVDRLCLSADELTDAPAVVFAIASSVSTLSVVTVRPCGWIEATSYTPADRSRARTRQPFGGRTGCSRLRASAPSHRPASVCAAASKVAHWSRRLDRPPFGSFFSMPTQLSVADHVPREAAHVALHSLEKL